MEKKELIVLLDLHCEGLHLSRLEILEQVKDDALGTLCRRGTPSSPWKGFLINATKVVCPTLLSF